MIKYIKTLLDETAKEANERKIEIGLAHGYDRAEMENYISNPVFRRNNETININSLNWFRRRKNQDIKDKFTLEGLKNQYTVRAEKTMGALQEYQSKDDQKVDFNRFDLSWESSEKNFVLAMEIEMDMDHSALHTDFSKLLKNKHTKYKVMVCQTKTASEIEPFVLDCKGLIDRHRQNSGEYLVSAWNWELAKFSHYTFN